MPKILVMEFEINNSGLKKCGRNHRIPLHEDKILFPILYKLKLNLLIILRLQIVFCNPLQKLQLVFL